MNLSEVKFNQKVKILKIKTDRKTVQRLVSLGVCEGGVVTPIRSSLLNTAIMIEVGSIRVALRKDLTEKIEVKYE